MSDKADMKTKIEDEHANKIKQEETEKKDLAKATGLTNKASHDKADKEKKIENVKKIIRTNKKKINKEISRNQDIRTMFRRDSPIRKTKFGNNKLEDKAGSCTGSMEVIKFTPTTI